MAKSVIVEEKPPKKNTRSGSGTTLTNLDKQTLAMVYRYMYLARQIDNKAMNLLRQGKTYFHIAGAGHEAIQSALGLLLDSTKDWIFPYYRDLTLTLM